MSRHPSALPVPAVLFSGEVASEWQKTDPIFVGGAGVVDLFFRLTARPAGMTLSLPVHFDWYAQLNPTGEEEDWYGETVETAEADGNINYKPTMRHLAGLEGLLLAEVAAEPGELAGTFQHARLGLNARQLRLVFRGQLGSPGGRATITALRGR